MTIYNSYNVELASKIIQSVSLENFTEAYSLTNKKNMTLITPHKLLYKQFVTWSCNGCTIAPLTDYINSPIYQELLEESEYFSTSNERIYLDLRASYGYTKEMEKLRRNYSKLNLKIQLKSAAVKKLRFRI